MQHERAHIYIVSYPSAIQLQRSIKLRQKRPPQEWSILIALYTRDFSPESMLAVWKASQHFDAVEFLKLPRACHRINFKAVAKIYDIYRKLLDRLQPSYMTIFSFESHYTLLCKLAAERKIYTILSEEGLGTYKYLVVPEQRKVQKFGGFGLTRKKLRKLARNPFIIFPYIFKNLTQQEIFHVKRIQNHPDFSVILKPWKKFDKAMLVNPEILNGFLSYKELEILCDSYLDDGNKAQVEASVAQLGLDNSILFYASQRIPGTPSEVSLPLVLDILERIAKEEEKGEVYIKLHPKEEYAAERLIEQSEKRNIAFKFITGCPYAAEALIESAKPQAVISVGSSTLVYGHSGSPESKFISIVNALESCMQQKKLINRKNEVFFRDVRNLMPLFPHISLYAEDKFPNRFSANDLPHRTYRD